MAKGKVPSDKLPKIIREDVFDLNDWDKYVISGLAELMKSLSDARDKAQRSVTDYLASVAVQRWDFEQGPEISFEDFSLEDGKVKVVQYEATNNVPKDGAETNESADGSAEQAGPEAGTESASETEETSQDQG